MPKGYPKNGKRAESYRNPNSPSKTTKVSPYARKAAVDEDGDAKDFRDGELYETMVQIVRKYIQRQNSRVRVLDIVRTYPEVRDHIDSILGTLSAVDEIIIDDRSNVSFVFVEPTTPQERERRHALRRHFIADVARLPPSRLGGFQ